MGRIWNLRNIRQYAPIFPSKYLPVSWQGFSFPDSNPTFLTPVLHCHPRKATMDLNFHICWGGGVGGRTLSALAFLALPYYRFPEDLQATLFPFKTPAKALFVDLPYVFSRKLTLISLWSNVLRTFFFVGWCLWWSISYNFMFLICHIKSWENHG